MSDEKKIETVEKPKKAKKEKKVETPAIARPGSVILYNMTGQKLRFENIIGMFKTIENGSVVMELTSTDGRYRVIPVQPGMIFEWQPAEGK